MLNPMEAAIQKQLVTTVHKGQPEFIKVDPNYSCCDPYIEVGHNDSSYFHI